MLRTRYRPQRSVRALWESGTDLGVAVALSDSYFTNG